MEWLRHYKLEFGWNVLSRSVRAGYSPLSGELTSDTDSLLRGNSGWTPLLEVLSVHSTYKANTMAALLISNIYDQFRCFF